MPEETSNANRLLLALGGILAVPILLAIIHFFVPSSIQSQLAFSHDRFSIYTLWTAGYVHSSNAHLQSNVLGYLLTTVYAYMLCADIDERRWFQRTFLAFLIILPVLVNLTSYGIFTFQYPSISPTSRGFSGVVAGFGGFLFVALVVYIRKHYTKQLGNLVGFVSFLVLMVMIDFIYGGIQVEVVGLVLAGFVLYIGSYVHEHGLSVNLNSKRKAKHVAAVVLVFGVLAYVVAAMFPADVVQGGSFSNVYAHATGFVYGAGLSFVIYSQ